MTKTSIQVTAVVPCLNEEGFIRQCIDSLLAQDMRPESFEILCVLGPNSDRTEEIVAKYAQRYPNIIILHNPRKNTAVSFNLGVKAARGKYFFTLGAHTTYSPNYFSAAVKYFNNYDCVGSIARTIPREPTLMGKSICLVLTSPFGVGNSKMRTGVAHPVETDTASCPGYRMEVFTRIGRFNEHLKHTQDMEFNRRLKRAGGKILATPEICSYYKARSHFASYCRANYVNGFWSIYPIKYCKGIPVSLRHFVPLIFVLTLLILGILSFWMHYPVWPFYSVALAYVTVMSFYILKILLQEKEPRYMITLPVLFFLLHVLYGLGSLIALTRIFPRKIDGGSLEK